MNSIPIWRTRAIATATRLSREAAFFSKSARPALCSVAGSSMQSFRYACPLGRHGSTKKYRELLAIKRNTADSRLPSKSPRSIHPRVKARKEDGRSSDLRAFRSHFGAHRIPTGHRFPGIIHPSAYDGARSLLPLRGSPGFSPGSHLIADPIDPRTVCGGSMQFSSGRGQEEGPRRDGRAARRGVSRPGVSRLLPHGILSGTLYPKVIKILIERNEGRGNA